MLSETGQPRRASPLRGRYLVHFAPLNLALGLIDRLLGLLPRKTSVDPVPLLPRAPRILLSQPGHLGDVVIATAVLAPLRELFPGCTIGVLVASWSARVLSGHPDVAAVHVFDHALLNRSPGWLQRLRRHRALRRVALSELRAMRYDAAIELSFNFPNNIAVLHAAGIAVRVGYTSGGFGPLLTHPLTWVHRATDSVMAYHEALLQQLVGTRPLPVHVVRSRLPLKQAGLGAALPAGHAAAYTVVHMGSGGARKEWPDQHWHDLTRMLLAQGRHLVFTGSGAEEVARVASIVAGLPDCTNLCSRQDWPAFVETIAGATAVIAVDSAAGHVAAAFNVPTVTIAHGMTDAALYKPQSPVNTALRHFVPCLPCYRSRGCASMECIRNVDPVDVMGAPG